MVAAAAFAPDTSHPTAGEIATRVMRRAARKLLLSPWTWIITAALVSLSLVTNVRPLHPAPIATTPDAADRYVEALRTGDVDALLASLSPEARTELGVLGRFIGPPGTPAERRAARTVVARDHIDRYARLGDHRTPDGSFVVYAIERDTPDGTHAQPLVVWLDRDGKVVRTSM